MKRFILVLCLIVITCEDKTEAIPLKADFSVKNSKGSRPLTVSFHNNSTPSSSVISWEWDFGDSTYSSEKNPIHVFNKMGKYSVKLTVYNVEGDSSTIYKVDIVDVQGIYLVHLVDEFKVELSLRGSWLYANFVYTLQNIGDFNIGGWDIAFQPLEYKGIQGWKNHSYKRYDSVRLTEWMKPGDTITTKTTADFTLTAQDYFREFWGNCDSIAVVEFEIVNPSGKFQSKINNYVSISNFTLDR